MTDDPATDVPPKRRAGRPQFKPSADQRRTVEQCAAIGMSYEATARLLGIDRSTLASRFAVELECGAARIRAAAFSMLWRSAQRGNVSAQKRALEIVTATLARQEIEAKPTRQEPLGKKERANLDARDAGRGTEWEAWLRMDGEPDPDKPPN